MELLPTTTRDELLISSVRCMVSPPACATESMCVATPTGRLWTTSSGPRAIAQPLASLRSIARPRSAPSSPVLAGWGKLHVRTASERTREREQLVHDTVDSLLNQMTIQEK